MKKEKTFFSVTTIFHLMMTKLYIQKNNIKNPIILCYSKNSTIEELVRKDQDFSEILIVDRNEKANNKITMGIRNKKHILKAKNFIKNKKIDQLIVFKDNDFLNQTLINAAYHKKAKITLMEEGLGLYKIPNEGLKITNEKIIKRYFLSYPKKKYNVQGINPQVSEVIATAPYFLSNEKKINKEIQTVENKKISDRNIEYLYDYFNMNNIDIKERFQNKKMNILFIGQPFSEFNNLDRKKEKEALDRIINTLLSKDKYNIIIKPHPSEDIQKYKSYLLSKSVMLFEEYHIPAELIPSKTEIYLVLTAYSSACYYINKWYGIKSLSLYKIFFQKQPSIDFEERLTDMYNMHILNDLTSMVDYLFPEPSNDK